MLGTLGNIYQEMAQYEKSIDLYQQSLGILREIGHKYSEGIALGNLGNTYANIGFGILEALECFNQSLSIVS